MANPAQKTDKFQHLLDAVLTNGPAASFAFKQIQSNLHTISKENIEKMMIGLFNESHKIGGESNAYAHDILAHIYNSGISIGGEQIVERDSSQAENYKTGTIQAWKDFNQAGSHLHKILENRSTQAEQALNRMSVKNTNTDQNAEFDWETDDMKVRFNNLKGVDATTHQDRLAQEANQPTSIPAL